MKIITKNTCDVCGRRVANMRQHKRNNHNFKLVECKYCGKSVKDNYLNCHVKKKHTGPQTYTCQTCGQKFKDHPSVKFHCVVKHNDTSHGIVKIFPCKHCGGKFGSCTR